MVLVNVALIGPGLVGKEFLSQVFTFKSSRVSFKLLGLINSTKMAINLDGISEEKAYLENITQQADLDEFLTTLPQNTIIIDCTSSPKISNLYPKILTKHHIITPNKKPFSSSLELYKQIKSSHRFVYHESSVGAGLPIISTISDMIISGDKIISIEGILSGTLSYIFNTFSSPSSTTSFSKVVQEAKNLGYTEPDPRDDLNGLDVARKIVILARECGLEVCLEDVDVENIVPEALRQLPLEEFMKELPGADGLFEKLNSEAVKDGKVLRYVGSIKDGKCAVKLKRYDTLHAFGSMKGSDNVIAITTERFPNPMVYLKSLIV